ELRGGDGTRNLSKVARPTGDRRQGRVQFRGGEHGGHGGYAAAPGVPPQVKPPRVNLPHVAPQPAQATPAAALGPPPVSVYRVSDGDPSLDIGSAASSAAAKSLRVDLPLREPAKVLVLQFPGTPLVLGQRRVAAVSQRLNPGTGQAVQLAKQVVVGELVGGYAAFRGPFGPTG